MVRWCLHVRLSSLAAGMVRARSRLWLYVLCLLMDHISKIPGRTVAPKSWLHMHD